MLVHVESANQFNELVKKGIVLVDFFATWCGPCRMLGPELEKLAAAEPEITILKVDCDELGEIAAHYSVSSIPAMFLIKDGKVVGTQVGFLNLKGLQQFVAQAK